jgi:molybdenum cofactor guanylyltransferase
MSNSSPLRADVAAIYAGGAGARLGGIEKGALQVDGVPLWRRVADRLRPQARVLFVLSPTRPDWMDDLGDARWISDAAPPVGDQKMDGRPVRNGPAGGLVAALRLIQTELGPDARLVTAPVDAPCLPADLFVRLETARLDAKSCVALAHHAGGQHPVFGVWQARCAGPVSTAFEAGERALHRLAAHAGATTCAAWSNAQPDPFLNINTPEDMAAVEAVMAQRH